MRENHPDSLAARGVPAEFIARASDKVARINAPGTGSSASAGCEASGLRPQGRRADPVYRLSGSPRWRAGQRLARIRDLPSPNQDDAAGRRADRHADPALHRHADSAQAAIDRLRDPAAQVSSHYVVDEDGTVLRLVPEERRAYHAGVSYWRGHTELNGRSIGIEIVNPGHEWGYRDFPVLQLAAVCDLCLEILSRHPIPARNIVAHSDVAPDRKEDPGEKFDWEGLARNGVGLWPEGVPDLGTGGAGARRRKAARRARGRWRRSAIGWRRRGRSIRRWRRCCVRSSGTGGRRRSPARRMPARWRGCWAWRGWWGLRRALRRAKPR